MVNNKLPVLNRANIGAPQVQELQELHDETSLNLRDGHLGEQSVFIRPFRSSDIEIFHRMCCDSAFLGHPMDSLFQDRDLFADLFTKAYLDYEADWIFVAEVHGQVVGYLLGSVRKHFDLLLMRSGLRTTARMLLRLCAGRYAGHSRSRRFIRWLLTSAFHEQPKHPPEAAHLHIQLEKDFRGRGVGRRLWEHYEQKLREAGIKRCYGTFYSHCRRRPELAYARYGFTVFDRCRTTMFQPEISDPVEVVCVVKEL